MVATFNSPALRADSLFHFGCQDHTQTPYLCPCPVLGKTSVWRVCERVSVRLGFLGLLLIAAVCLHGSDQLEMTSPPDSPTLTEYESLQSLWVITSRVFPAVTDISLFIWWGKETGVGGGREGGELTGEENGSIMSVGRLTSDILSM